MTQANTNALYDVLMTKFEGAVNFINGVTDHTFFSKKFCSDRPVNTFDSCLVNSSVSARTERSAEKFDVFNIKNEIFWESSLDFFFDGVLICSCFVVFD